MLRVSALRRPHPVGDAAERECPPAALAAKVQTDDPAARRRPRSSPSSSATVVLQEGEQDQVVEVEDPAEPAEHQHAAASMCSELSQLDSSDP